jgi:general nucleoside transport system permease protein
MSDQPGPVSPATVDEKEDEQEPRASFGQTVRDSIVEGHTVTIVILAIFTGFVVGGLLNAFTNTAVLHAWGHFFSAPGHAIAAAWDTAVGAYVAMFQGSIVNPHTVTALF